MKLFKRLLGFFKKKPDSHFDTYRSNQKKKIEEFNRLLQCIQTGDEYKI